MGWIDLGNPKPREQAGVYIPLSWPDGEALDLPAGSDQPSDRSFAHISRSRRSRRKFQALDIKDLGALLDLSCRVQAGFSFIEGLSQSTRPAASAGALHPVHLIIHRHADDKWMRYDPYGHSLAALPSNTDPLVVRASLNEVLPGESATLILFAAEPGLTFAKYAAGCSLVWRDAGVLQGHLCLAAESLGLNFCLLGITGEPWTSTLVEQNGLVGVGAAYAGSA